jgi:hypothetical protein
MGSRRILKRWWLWMQVAAVLACAIGVHGQPLGTWQIVVANAGIAAMHAAVTNYGTVVLLDRTNIGASQIALPSKSPHSSKPPSLQFSPYPLHFSPLQHAELTCKV